MILADSVGDAIALYNQLADTLPEVEGETTGDARGDAQEVVYTLADSLEEVEA